MPGGIALAGSFFCWRGLGYFLFASSQNISTHARRARPAFDRGHHASTGRIPPGHDVCAGRFIAPWMGWRWRRDSKKPPPMDIVHHVRDLRRINSEGPGAGRAAAWRRSSARRKCCGLMAAVESHDRCRRIAGLVCFAERSSSWFGVWRWRIAAAVFLYLAAARGGWAKFSKHTRPPYVENFVAGFGSSRLIDFLFHLQA